MHHKVEKKQNEMINKLKLLTRSLIKYASKCTRDSERARAQPTNQRGYSHTGQINHWHSAKKVYASVWHSVIFYLRLSFHKDGCVCCVCVLYTFATLNDTHSMHDDGKTNEGFSFFFPSCLFWTLYKLMENLFTIFILLLSFIFDFFPISATMLLLLLLLRWAI